MADCNKAVDFIKEWNRMCEAMNCDVLHLGEDMISTVQQWSDSHPEPKGKTYLEDFLEKFPNCSRSKIYKNEVPESCRDLVYGTKFCKDYANCKECWNEVMAE